MVVFVAVVSCICNEVIFVEDLCFLFTSFFSYSSVGALCVMYFFSLFCVACCCIRLYFIDVGSS